MKKLLFIGIGSALMVTMGGVGSASANNGPHSIPMAGINTAGVIVANMGATQCANCHRAHTAKTDKLTLQAQPAICLNCHGGLGSNTDVADGVDGTSGAGLRGGGFTNAVIDSANGQKDMGALSGTRIATSNRLIPALAMAARKPVTSTHQINGGAGDSGTMWGNGTTGVGQLAVTLECGSCHDPHGNGNYRILKPSPDGQQYEISAAVPAGPGGVPAAIPAVLSVATTVNIPDQVGINYTVKTAASAALVSAGTAAALVIPSTPASLAAIQLGAAAANGNYWDVQAVGTPLQHAPGFSAPATDTTLGTVASPGHSAAVATDGYLGNISAWCTTCHTRYLSHSASDTTGDAIYTYKHRSDEGLSDKPNCIQCHVSHGSNAAMAGVSAAVTSPGGGAAVSANDSRLLRVDNRGVCLECHNM